MKLDSLRTLSIVDEGQSGKQYEPFAKELITDTDPRLVNIARASLFQARVNEFLNDPDADSANIAAELEQLLSQEGLNEDVFVAARDALSWLFQNGHLQIATQGFKQLATSFKDHDDAKVADEAKSLLTQAVQLELNQDIDRVLAGEADSTPNLIKALTAALESAPDIRSRSFGGGSSDRLRRLNLRANSTLLGRFIRYCNNGSLNRKKNSLCRTSIVPLGWPRGVWISLVRNCKSMVCSLTASRSRGRTIGRSTPLSVSGRVGIWAGRSKFAAFVRLPRRTEIKA